MQIPPHTAPGLEEDSPVTFHYIIPMVT